MALAAVGATLAWAGPMASRGQAPPAAPRSPEACQPALIGTAPLIPSQRRFAVTAAVNGARLLLLADTGAQSSGLTPATLKTLRLKNYTGLTVRVTGVGGDFDDHPREASSLFLGGFFWPGPILFTPFHVDRQEVEADPATPVGVIGASVFSAHDVAFDFPARTVSFYDTACGAAVRPPWPGQFDSFPASESRSGMMTVPVILDGRLLHALVDTGSNTSSIGRSAAKAMGLPPAALAQDPATTFVGAVGKPVRVHNHRFATFRLGSMIAKDPVIPVLEQDFQPGVDMLLGMDVLKLGRLWLSYSTGQVAIQVTEPAPAAVTPKE
jgi:predicted aspartyl protease